MFLWTKRVLCCLLSYVIKNPCIVLRLITASSCLDSIKPGNYVIYILIFFTGRGHDSTISETGWIYDTCRKTERHTTGSTSYCRSQITARGESAAITRWVNARYIKVCTFQNDTTYKVIVTTWEMTVSCFSSEVHISTLGMWKLW